MKLLERAEKDILNATNDIIERVYLDTNFPSLPLVRHLADVLEKLDLRTQMFVQFFDICYVVIITYSEYGRAIFLDSSGYEILTVSFENDDEVRSWME